MWRFLSQLLPGQNRPQEVDASDSVGFIDDGLNERIDNVLREAGEGFVEIGFRSRSYRTGARRTVFTGPSGDFYKTEEYVPGEHDPRQIMARASACTGGRNKYVKVCRPDAQSTVYVVADINRTLDFGHSRESKLWLMARCAATICLSLKETQDLVRGGLYANESLVYTMPRAMVPTMAVREMVGGILNPVHSTGKLDSGLEDALRIVPPTGSRELVVLSDFLNVTASQFEALSDISKRNSVRAIVIQDLRERVLPQGSRFIPTRLNVFDLSSGKMESWWLNERNRQRYTREFEEHEAKLRLFFEENNIRYEMVSTDEGMESISKVIGLLASPPLLS